MIEAQEARHIVNFYNEDIEVTKNIFKAAIESTIISEIENFIVLLCIEKTTSCSINIYCQHGVVERSGNIVSHSTKDNTINFEVTNEASDIIDSIRNDIFRVVNSSDYVADFNKETNIISINW